MKSFWIIAGIILSIVIINAFGKGLVAEYNGTAQNPIEQAFSNVQSISTVPTKVNGVKVTSALKSGQLEKAIGADRY